jgi:LacI family transcriptional regulator, galactose operon repressor
MRDKKSLPTEKKSSGVVSRLTIRDIAMKAGVSVSTVSMILNGKQGISEDTRHRVQTIIDESGYTPNLIARSLVKRRSHAVAFLVKRLQHPIYNEIAAGIDEILKPKGYSLSIISTEDDGALERIEIRKIIARGIDGILTAAALVDNDNMTNLVDSGFPVVAILRRVYNCGGLDYVTVDNQKGAFLAVEHLIRLGHRRIGIVKGPSNNSTGIERFKGVLQAFNTYGLQISEGLVQEGDYLQEVGYVAARNFLEQGRVKRPTAIFASNDDMALGSFQCIWELGLRIPEDIALVGFNDVKITSFCTVQMTTISQHNYEMGRLGAQRLIEKLEQKEGLKKKCRVILEPELVIRKSCGFSLLSGYKRERKGG